MKQKICLLEIIVTTALLLAACSPAAGENAAQTSVASPAAISETATLIPLPSSTYTLTPFPTITQTPTITPTPTRTEIPLPVWAWAEGTVDSGKQGIYPSLAIGPDDVPYIAYMNDAEDDLKIASYKGGAWGINAFESPWVDGLYPSIVIDNQGRPQVARWIMSMRRLAYMPWTKENGWDVTTSLTKIRVASTSLALDHAKKQVPHIAYFDIDANEVKYALYRPSGWVLQSIDQTTADGVLFPLALDSADRPYVAYYKDQVGLVFAQQNEDGKTWETQVVDAGAGIGLYPALVLDVDGIPHISYMDTVAKTLKYAHLVDGAWDIQVVDGSGNAAGATSIALSPEGYIHISYTHYDQVIHVLMHAVGMLDQWLLTTVDKEGDVGLYNSLALDSLGNPHISYYDGSGSRSLKYTSGS